MSPVFWQPGITLEEVEEQVIRKAFIHFEGNKTRTAKALDIAIRTLDAKLAKYKAKDEANEKRTFTNKD